MFFHSPYTSATKAQLQCLEELGIWSNGWISSHQADQLIKEHYEEWSQLPPTPRQEQLIRQRCCWHPCFTRGDATKLLGKLYPRLGQDEF